MRSNKVSAIKKSLSKSEVTYVNTSSLTLPDVEENLTPMIQNITQFAKTAQLISEEALRFQDILTDLKDQLNNQKKALSSDENYHDKDTLIRTYQTALTRYNKFMRKYQNVFYEFNAPSDASPPLGKLQGEHEEKTTNLRDRVFRNMSQKSKRTTRKNNTLALPKLSSIEDINLVMQSINQHTNPSALQDAITRIARNYNSYRDIYQRSKLGPVEAVTLEKLKETIQLHAFETKLLLPYFIEWRDKVSIQCINEEWRRLFGYLTRMITLLGDDNKLYENDVNQVFEDIEKKWQKKSVFVKPISYSPDTNLFRRDTRNLLSSQKKGDLKNTSLPTMGRGKQSE